MIKPAYAYIDPSIGTFILQGIVAAVAIVGIAFATVKERVSYFFRSLPGKAPKDNESDTTKTAKDGDVGEND